MKYIFLFLITINLYSQDKEIFNIEYIQLYQKLSETELSNTFPESSKYFFEDDNYIVLNSCRGEFGGNIIFKSKKDSAEYICAATCPVAINKINNKYYLTTSLSHMSGNCRLFEIENPTELSKISLNDQDSEYFDKRSSLVGVKTLFDLYHKTILTSFTFQNRLYHIVSEGPKVYIAERESSELKIVQNLKGFGILYPGSQTFSVSEKQKVASFRAKGVTGYFDIFENKITVYTYN